MILGQKSIARFRRVLEKMYDGVCVVTEYIPGRDPVTKKTTFVETPVLTAQPCRLSFSSSPVTGDDNVASVVQETKLFISPDVTIKKGSKITVTQNGVTTDYTHSSEPKIYATHQEITLKLFEGWA